MDASPRGASRGGGALSVRLGAPKPVPSRAALVRRWGDAIEATGSTALLDQVRDLLRTRTQGGATGLLVETERGYDTLRRAIRAEQLAVIGRAGSPAAEAAELRRMLESVPEGDVGSLGQLNEAYFRTRIRSEEAGRRFAGIEGLPLDTGARSAGGARRADDVVRLTADAGGERRVAPGRYLVDYKAGESAFDLDQARRYADTLTEQSDVTGVLYVFTGRGDAEAAVAAARRARDAASDAQEQVARAADVPESRRTDFLFAYLNETGQLTWL